MTTSKAPKTGADHAQSERRTPPSASVGGGQSTSPDVDTLKIDVDAYDSGDPYNRTGQHLVEQLRRKFEQQ
ncbi:MAG: hypothetical protein AAFX10_00375 [Pseudomonadota bacterium]